MKSRYFCTIDHSLCETFQICNRILRDIYEINFFWDSGVKVEYLGAFESIFDKAFTRVSETQGGGFLMKI
jgi:hypothetical protein